MRKIRRIYTYKEVFVYFKKRQLSAQYEKAIYYLKLGNLKQVQLKKREPKNANIWYFRVNKQFRAICTFDSSNNLIIFDVDSHQ